VVGLQALFELAVCPAEQPSARNCAAHLGVERRKPCPRGRRALVTYDAVFPSCALPNPPAAVRQQGPVLTCATVPFYLGYPWGGFFDPYQRLGRGTGRPPSPGEPARPLLRDDPDLLHCSAGLCAPDLRPRSLTRTQQPGSAPTIRQCNRSAEPAGPVGLTHRAVGPTIARGANFRAAGVKKIGHAAPKDPLQVCEADQDWVDASSRRGRGCYDSRQGL
jgi:hypothetical protein